MTDLSEFHALTEAEELRAALREIQGKHKKAKAKTEDLVEAVHTGAKAGMLALGNPPKVPAPTADRRKGKPEAALLMLSDWQLGKHTSSYNTEVCLERLRLLAKKVRRIVEIERADHPVREIHTLLGGDLVENTVTFPGQAYEVDSTLFEQMFAAAGAVVEMIRDQLAVFEKVHIWTEPGNHGRLGRKGDHPASDNADLMVYTLARERLREFEGKGRLTWHERHGWHSVVRVGNYSALFVHGHQIKSFGGQTPAFGIARKVNAWASGVVDSPFTDCMMGHFHAPHVIPLANGRGRVFVNPSTESDSIFAKEFVGATGTPGQRLHFIEPEKGRITSERVVWLDD